MSFRTPALHPELWPALLLILGVGGCLLSVTKRIDFDVAGTHRSTEALVTEIAVDLAEQDEDYRDHRNKIKSVDEVGFVLRAKNNLAAESSGELYLSSTRLQPEGGPLTADDVRRDGELILSGIILPAEGSLDVDYEESLEFEENRDLLHEAVLNGKFYLYGIGGSPAFDLTLEQLTVIVTATVES